MKLFKSTIQNPKVTVCIPTYNQENFISKALDSVLSQGIKSLQIIVSDDASTDFTPEIIMEYKKNHPTIIDIILHDKNLGIAGNANSIYPLIKGEYVSWFAGDDLFLPGKLVKQIKVLDDNPNCLMCCHDVLVRDACSGSNYRFNDPIKGVKYHYKDLPKRLITEGCFISAMSILVRRNNTLNIMHREDVGISNDWLYIIEIAMQGQVIYLKEVLGIYNKHDRSTTKLDISHRHHEAVYNYMKVNFAKDYEKEIFEGLSLLYASYLLNYIKARRIINSLLMFGKLLLLLLNRKNSLSFLTRRAYQRKFLNKRFSK